MLTTFTKPTFAAKSGQTVVPKTEDENMRGPVEIATHRDRSLLCMAAGLALKGRWLGSKRSAIFTRMLVS